MGTTMKISLVLAALLCSVQIGAPQNDAIRISAAVYQVLLPFMDEMRAGLETVKSDLASLDVKVCKLTNDLEDLRNWTASDLAALHTSLQFSIDNPPTEVMGNAVLRSLLPYMNRIEDNLGNRVNSLGGYLEEINKTVANLSDSQMVEELDFKLASVNVSTTESLRAMRYQLEEHENRTTAIQSTHTDQLTQLCAKMDAMDSILYSLSSAMNRVNLTAVESQVEEHNYRVSSTLVALQTKQDTIDSKLDQLDSKQDELDMKVMFVNTELEHNLLSNVTKQLHDLAEYNDLHVCGGTGGWRRVVYLNMTNTNTTCPSGWQLTTRSSKRTCDIVNTGLPSCDSVFFPVSGRAYNRVCGTIRGYQYHGTDAFQAYHDGDAITIDGAYVSGVSLTHGSPRQHIWTFAAGITEVHPTRNDACPCDATIDISIPSFVGGDYFCESGANSESWSGFHSGDPLWDGKKCTSSSTCCSFNNPPYFTKQLPNPTTDDLEIRLCHLDGDNTPIEFIELYLKFDEQNMKELEHNVLSVKVGLSIVKSDLSNITEMVTIMSESLEEHKTQTASELAGLQHDNNFGHEEIEEDMTSLYSSICDKIEEHDNYTTTKLAILDRILQHHSQLNGYPIYTCGGTGGWRRVVLLDMADPNTHCPSGWQLTGFSKRTCGKVSTGSLTCDSVIFPVSGGAYTSVCGRVIAYQEEYTDAFEAYDKGRATTIDSAYVSGVSLTHGSPRQHIWTFAAGIAEGEPTQKYMLVLAMQLLILPSHHLWVETISVNQEPTCYDTVVLNHMILCGMARTVLVAVHVVHSTILHISLSDSPTLPLMI